MDSRRAILDAVGRSAAPERLPGYTGDTIRFQDPVDAFRDALDAAGGTLVCVADRATLEAALALEAREVPILAGGPAVAECGAVWWAPRGPEERREAFLAERVVMVVDRSALVDDLHEAYRQIDPAAVGYGCFVSGPSKTADIEQALVIGAHGPRELTVILVGEEVITSPDPDGSMP